MYDWSDRLADGGRGVETISRLLRARPDTLDVQDVQMDPEYRARDIDLLWRRRRLPGYYEQLTIEVKWDRYTTGNIAFETLSVVEQEIPGCFLTSKADLWYYCFPSWSKAYILPLPRTRAWFLEKGGAYPRKITSSIDRERGRTWHTEFAVLPLTELLAAVPEIEIVVFPHP